MTPASQSSTGDGVVYVYGVTRADAVTAAGAPLVEGIVPRVAVELLPIGRLAIVVSRGLRADFAPANPDAPGDAAWATGRALAHHRVLAALAPVCPVAPVKFGALCRDLDDLLTLFARSAPAFERALDRIAGAQEWGVKLYADPEACALTAGDGPGVAALRAEIAAASPGTAFFLARKLRAAVDAEMHGRLERVADSVHRRLAGKAREAAANPIRVRAPAPRTGSARKLVLDAAYLVDTAGNARFHRTLAALGKLFAADGFVFEPTGPWPPYSFAAIETEVAADG